MPLSLDSDDDSGWVKNDRRPYRATIHFNDETHSFQTCVQRQPLGSRDYRCHGRSAAVKAMAPAVRSIEEGRSQCWQRLFRARNGCSVPAEDPEGLGGRS